MSSTKNEKVGLNLDNGCSPCDQTKENLQDVSMQDARKLSNQTSIQALVQVCQCRDANCQLTCCYMMKRIVTLEPDTQTPPANVLPVVKQEQEEAARHQAPHVGVYGKVNPGGVPGQNMPPQMRIEGHLGPGQGDDNLLPMAKWPRYPGPNTQNLRQPGPQLAQSAGQLSSGHMQQANQLRQPLAQAFTATYTKSIRALQQLKAALESPQTLEQQQQQILQILKSNPQLLAAYIKQRQRFFPYMHAKNVFSGPQLAHSAGQWSFGHIQLVNQLRQPLAQAFTAANTNTKRALQQLMAALKSAQTHEQQQHILQILKSNPQLLAACIKHRQLAHSAGQWSSGRMQQANQLRQPLAQAFTATNTNSKQALQQLMAVLKSPQTPEQQQQIFQILKSNPQLLAAYIKDRELETTVQTTTDPDASTAAAATIPTIRQPHMGHTNTLQDQNFQQELKPTPPPMPSPQGVIGPPQGSISLQQQHQLIQSVRSPPPIASPQPNPSPRPTPSPRNQPVPSPRGPQPSPHELAASEMLLGQNHTSGLHPHASPASQNQETGDMTPQDQLSKFVEQL